MKPIVLAWIVVAMGILTTSTAAHAPSQELDGCHDDLDRLRRTASDASDAAEKFDDFEDCSRNPELHDLLRNGCRSQRSDYESALNDLESKMDDLDSRLYSVQSSCGYDFTINRMSPVEASQRRLDAAKRRLCTSLKEPMRLGIPPDKALQNCKENADDVIDHLNPSFSELDRLRPFSSIQ